MELSCGKRDNAQAQTCVHECLVQILPFKRRHASIFPSLPIEDEVDGHKRATENACATIAKILHFNNSKVQNVSDVVAGWVDTLPVTNDEEAAPYAYSFLAQLIDE